MIPKAVRYKVVFTKSDTYPNGRAWSVPGNYVTFWTKAAALSWMKAARSNKTVSNMRLHYAQNGFA